MIDGEFAPSAVIIFVLSTSNGLPAIEPIAPAADPQHRIS
jgi:hypothetical protein